MLAIKTFTHCLVIIAIAVAIADRANAQTASPTDAERAMAAKIKCGDFKKNPDGSWSSGPNAKIGAMEFRNHRFEVGGFNFSGADVAVVLDQKCGRSR
jgi:hypothetical protein